MPKLTLTEPLQDAIADAVSRGVPLETACIAAGVGHSTARQWLTAAQEGVWPQSGSRISEHAKRAAVAFANKLERARAEWEAKQVAAIAEAALQHNAKTGVREWRASAWLLNNHPRTRERYHEHRTSSSTSTQTVSHVHTVVRQLSDDELLALSQRAEQKMLDSGTAEQ